MTSWVTDAGPLVLSLCDRTGVMVDPWLEAGFRCMTVDIAHEEGVTTDGQMTWVGADVRTWLPPLDTYAIVFAFPPCTHLAQSGARWFKDKGLGKLVEGIELVESCRRICEWSGAPWMLENPVGQLSTYWRKPDHYFDPYEYAGYALVDEAYTKKTCLWVSEGFVMPTKLPVPVTEEKPRIHWAKNDASRGDVRSVTPSGFARAVFEANVDRVRERAA